MASAGLSESRQSAGWWRDGAPLAIWLRSALPPLLFGLRLWAAVCLALYLAFWLELDNASWAGTSAAIVCQPTLGASLRKGWFRIVGTIIGAVMIVVLTALFPQDRIGFLLFLALWGAVCGFLSTLLRNFASYAAALAGYTAVLVGADVLGATGGPSDAVFLLAISRATEISIGIISAGIVLGATDFGDARRRLAGQLAALSVEITIGLVGSLTRAGQRALATLSLRRDLTRRVIALDPVIDEAIGETSDLRPRSPVLQEAVGGLFTALGGWWMTALHLERLPRDMAQREADLVLSHIPPALLAPAQGDASGWIADALGARRACTASVRALAAMPTDTPSIRLLADRTAEALIGIRHALDGLLLLDDPVRKIPGIRRHRFWIADALPALVNGARVFLAIAATSAFWIATAWPSGGLVMAFAAITVLLFSARAELAYMITIGFTLGTVLTIVLAAIIGFAVLPGTSSFIGFALALGLVFVPAAAALAVPWNPVIFTAVIVTFTPLLGPANQMSYDTQAFYNAALAILAGAGSGAAAFSLVPALSPALRARRLLALSLRDLRRLARGPVLPTPHDWRGRVQGRLAALPQESEPLQRVQLLAVFTVGTGIIRLCRVVRRFDAQAELGEALAAVADGRVQDAAAWLDRLDRRLAALPATHPGANVRLRARARILAMSEALMQQDAYFGAGAAA